MKERNSEFKTLKFIKYIISAFKNIIIEVHRNIKNTHPESMLIKALERCHRD